MAAGRGFAVFLKGHTALKGDTFEQEEEISLSDIASELQEQDKEIKAAQDELLSQFAELTASDEQAQAEIAELMKTLEGLF